MELQPYRRLYSEQLHQSRSTTAESVCLQPLICLAAKLFHVVSVCAVLALLVMFWVVHCLMYYLCIM